MSLSLSSRASLSVGAFADTGEVICNNFHDLLSHTAAMLFNRNNLGTNYDTKYSMPWFCLTQAFALYFCMRSHMVLPAILHLEFEVQMTTC